MVEKDGVTYKAHREPGREQTEFIRSSNLWFRPIEVRLGPDGALYVVDFCNQAVIHNDTRGPVHGPANAPRPVPPAPTGGAPVPRRRISWRGDRGGACASPR